MNTDELRALQAPLKKGYKEHPESARITSRAEGWIEGEEIVCRVPTWSGTTDAGFHPSAGGDGSQACSSDMLLQALVSCAGVTLKAVATALGLPLPRARVIAEGDWDARGTLGVDRSVPVGLTAVRLTFEIESLADPRKIDTLVQLTERYCVVYQTLAHPPALTTRHTLTAPEG
jgi:uncharacterized OsmC-like protein